MPITIIFGALGVTVVLGILAGLLHALVTKNLRRFFLIVNYAMLMAFLVAWFHASFVAALGGPGRVMALDRAGVFNEEKLREFSPRLAENLRNNVGRWIQEPEKKAAVFYSYVIGGISLVNIAGFHLLTKRRREGQRDGVAVDS